MQRHVFPVLLMGAIGIVSAQADPLSLTPSRYAQFNVRPPTPAYIAPQAQPAPVAAERRRAQYASANSDVNLGGGFIEFLFSGGRAVAPPRPPSDMICARRARRAGGSRRRPACGRPEIFQAGRALLRLGAGRHHRHRHAAALPVPGAGQRQGAALRHRRRQAGLHLGRREESSPRRNGRIGRRRRRCCSGGRTCRTSWPAARRIRWARARCISAPRSIASTARTSPGPSAQAVSSGCIRMRNEDVIDLYEKVKVGTKVVVI